MHEDLLPPLVASFDECVVRVVLMSRIDSTHILRVTLNRDRLLKIGLTAALFRECSSEGNQALVDPSDTFSKLLQLNGLVQFPTQYHKNQFVGVPVLLLVGGDDSDSRAEKGLSASIVH